MKDFVKEWHAKLKAAYEGLTPDSEEGQRVAAMVDSIDQLQQLFAEGLVEASENYKAGQDKGAKESEPAAMAASRRTSATERDLGSDVRYSRKADINDICRILRHQMAHNHFCHDAAADIAMTNK